MESFCISSLEAMAQQLKGNDVLRGEVDQIDSDKSTGALITSLQGLLHGFTRHAHIRTEADL